MKTIFTQIRRSQRTGAHSLFRAGVTRVAIVMMTLALFFMGCDPEDDDRQPNLTLTPSLENITFSAGATESYTFKVKVYNTAHWSAVSDQDWCKISMDIASSTFTVTALPNLTDTEPTPADIIIRAADKFITAITAVQAAGMTDYDLYVSGYCETEGFDTYACYWKNGALTKLNVPSATPSSMSSSITVSDNSFYIAGAIDGWGSYWKGGEPVDLSDKRLSGAGSIAVEGNNVYMCGSDYYWNGSEKVNTPGVTNATFTANALVVSGGSAYIVGQTYLSGLFSAHQASYWSGKPSESTKALSTPTASTNANATCAFASDGSFYAGGYFVAEGKQNACYWKDGTCTVLEAPEGMTSSYVGGICVANKIVYVTGSCENDDSSIACYWADGRRIELALPSGVSSVRTTGIAVAGDKVCVAGQYRDAANKLNSCYWVNGERTELLKGAATESVYATGIALIAK